MKKRLLRRVSAFAVVCLLLMLTVKADAGSRFRTPERWINWYSDELVIDESLLALSSEIAVHCENGTDLPRCLHDWVCNNIYYDWDAFYAGTYGSLDPADVLDDKKGVCENIANLVQGLFIAADIPCIKVWGIAIEDETTWEETELPIDKVNHTWNEFYMNGAWHVIDCTMDMRNRYENNSYTRLESVDTFFDSDVETFSKTHLALYRSNNSPRNTPSAWAKDELTEAINCRVVPLEFFCDYQKSVTEAELRKMINLEAIGGASVTRGVAAVIISGQLGADHEQVEVFNDIFDCDKETIEAINALYHAGITLGTGEGTFSPNAPLTRQEAIILIKRLVKGGIR